MQHPLATAPASGAMRMAAPHTGPKETGTPRGVPVRITSPSPALTPNRSLLVCRKGLHRLRVHWDLHIIAVRRRDEQHAHARERVHASRIAKPPQPDVAEGDADLPRTEGRVTVVP